MRILALDQSVKRSGWAIVSGREIGPHGWFGSMAADDRRQVELFKDQVRQLILDYEPELLAWEAPAKFIPAFARKGGGTAVNAHQLVLTRLDQVLLGLANEFDLYDEAPAPKTWRAMVLGKGCGNLPKREAKRRAVAYCGWLGIQVPNDDVAEAICIGLWAASCSTAAKAEFT